MINIGYSKNFIYDKRKQKILCPNNHYIAVSLENASQISPFLNILYEKVLRSYVATTRIRDLVSDLELFKRYFTAAEVYLFEKDEQNRLPEMVATRMNNRETQNVFANWGFYKGGADITFCKPEYYQDLRDYASNHPCFREENLLYRIVSTGYVTCAIKQGLDYNIEIIVKSELFDRIGKVIQEYIASVM